MNAADFTPTCILDHAGGNLYFKDSDCLGIQRDRKWSEYFFDQGRGNREPGVAGTLWAGFNGVTEWLDHRKSRQNEGQRLNSVWFGESARVKNRAFEIALSLN